MEERKPGRWPWSKDRRAERARARQEDVVNRTKSVNLTRMRKERCAELEREWGLLTAVLNGREPFMDTHEREHINRVLNSIGHEKGSETFEKALDNHVKELERKIDKLKRGEPLHEVEPESHIDLEWE